MLYASVSASILTYSTWCINANIWHGIRATFLWPWFSVLTMCLRAIFVFLGVSSLRSSSLAFHYCRQHFLVYSHATIKNHINTARPLPSSNHYHRAKLHSRDLLILIKSQGFINLPSWIWRRGGVRDMLAKCNRPKSIPSNLGFSLL